MKTPYYMAYEKRYRTVFEAGVSRWGHSPDDPILYETLKAWVEENDLVGKKVVEFACGEGACGVILGHFHKIIPIWFITFFCTRIRTFLLSYFTIKSFFYLLTTSSHFPFSSLIFFIISFFTNYFSVFLCLFNNL